MARRFDRANFAARSLSDRKQNVNTLGLSEMADDAAETFCDGTTKHVHRGPTGHFRGR
jgi:hypothetical protein